jgi:phosphatidylserine/phosphatidylglycerophosphate/cardiolipin synthase-like enzyme
MGRVYSLASTLTVIFVAGLIAGALLTYSSATQQSRTTTVTTTLYATHTTTATVAATEKVGAVEVVCFSRAERCDDLLTGLIRGAKDRIYVAIYSFTSDRLAEALIEARRRGVDVRVVMERREANVTGSEYPRLLGAGVDVRLDANPGLMHHKFMVIDGEIVVTGSYNWSAAAEERNDENLVVIRDRGVAGAYEREFERIWSQSPP